MTAPPRPAPFSPLRLAPPLTLGLLLAPVALGLAWTLLPAFGYLPAIGGDRLGLQSWRALFAAPGFQSALRLTLVSGVLTTVLALLIAIGFCAWRATRPGRRALDRFLAPLMGSPHSAIALGLAFLILPSGWLVRLVSPWLTGFGQPPASLVTVQDPWGLSFVLGLLLKEVPYLVLMMMAASAQAPVERSLATARALGQRGTVAWLKAVFPQIYPQIRLPVFAVLAFSLSAVDVGLILAPGNPPPLSLLAARWFANYDLSLYFPAAAAASLQLAIALVAIGLWYGAEKLVAPLGRYWIERGAADRGAGWALGGLSAVAMAFGALGLLALLVMALWSVAGAWLFPDALPQRFTLDNWAAQLGRVGVTAGASLTVGLVAVLIAVGLALACLENEQRRGLRPGARALWLLYLPLLVPQIAFLFGVQGLLIRLGIDGTVIGVVWTHLVFVLPYVFLSLADPYRALDPRYAASAAALGATPLRVFLTVKLPILLRPILVAVAVGFAVSVAQYLPTLFAGAGRIATLTTEAVTLAGSADRRVIGVFVVSQSALPMIVYGLAIGLPRMAWRHRRALR